MTVGAFQCDVQKQIKDGICTKCRVANVECIVIHDNDRRKSGSNRHIAALKNRFQSLESMMAHHFRRNGEEAGEESHRVNERGTSPSSLAVPRSDSTPSSLCTYMSPSSSSQGAEASPLISTQATKCSTVEAEEDVGKEAALGLDSSQVQKVLLEIAWRYLSLQTGLVHEQYFLSHRDLGVRSQYYSPFLENALLACASRVSTSTSIRNLGKPYIDRAVKDIPMELENPTLSTIQSFLLLADFEATRDRDRLG